MWFVAVLVFSVCVDCCVRKRDIPPPPLLAFIAAALFAQPAVRNCLPSVPPAGVYLDYIGYFWHLLLVCFSLITLVFTYIARFSRPFVPVIVKPRTQ